MKAILPILVATALAASAQTSIVLYQADFSGSAATQLNGTAVDTSGATPAQHLQYGTVAGETWTADTVLFADGHVTSGDARGGATLAFTPQNGCIYTLTMTTSFAFSAADWVAVGFNEEVDYTDYQNAFDGGVAWALTRPGTTDDSQVAHFNPSGALGKVGGGDYYTTAPSTLTIVLDTTLGTGDWSATYYAGTAATGDLIATVPDMGTLETGIHSVSLGWQNSNATTKFDFMELSVVAVPPAPSSTALFDFNPNNAASTAYNAISMIGGTPDSTGDVSVNYTNSTPTGWTINVTNTAPITVVPGTEPDAGNAGDGANVATFPAALASFETNALTDSIFFNPGAQPKGELTVTISGLDNAKTYDLLFYGSRSSFPGTQTWDLTVGSGTAPQVSHSSANNTTTVVDWNGIAPDAGVIAFTISVDGGVGALNFGRVAETGSGGSPYGTWATGGELFTDDANGDGVDNGLAWILGALNPNVSALDKLPTLTTPPGFLQLNFTREFPYAPAMLYVEYGTDLSGWTKLLIPDELGTSTIGGDIEVTVGEGPPDAIQIKIPTSHASPGGKLFARLSATEN